MKSVTPNMDRDIIERDDQVIVVDEDGVSHTFTRVDGKEYVVEPDDADASVAEWLTETSDYTLPVDVEFPVEVDEWIHLEDTVSLTLSRELGEAFNDVYPGGVGLPSMELCTNWEFNANGKGELVSVEYDGTTYTPD